MADYSADSQGDESPHPYAGTGCSGSSTDARTRHPYGDWCAARRPALDGTRARAEADSGGDWDWLAAQRGSDPAAGRIALRDEPARSGVFCHGVAGVDGGGDAGELHAGAPGDEDRSGGSPAVGVGRALTATRRIYLRGVRYLLGYRDCLIWRHIVSGLWPESARIAGSAARSAPVGVSPARASVGLPTASRK